MAEINKRVCSLFAGIGGICRGFKDNNFEIVWANEIDKFACETYRINMKNYYNEDCNYLCEGDLCKILELGIEIPDFEVLCAGFPCQPFSLAGKQEGMNDARGQLFYRIIDVILLKNPQIILLENVKNLVGHDKGNTFKIIKKELEKIGFYVKFEILNSLDFNVPQNRERIYIVGFRDKGHFDKFCFPQKKELTNNIYSVINLNNKKQDKYYYLLNNEHKAYKNKIIEDKYKSFMEQIDYNNIFQIRRGMYVRQNKKGVCPTLTANMGGGGHNVPIIKDNFGIRKLTPEECFAFQGFDNFVRPEKMSDVHLYKQAGNSVSIPVIKEIVLKICEVL